MTSIAELRAKWETRREDGARFGTMARMDALCAELLADLDSLTAEDPSTVVTLKEASLIGGYSVDHLQRSVAAGAIENVGRKGAPRIRRSDVPRKPGHTLPTTIDADQFSVRRRIVRNALTTQRSA